MHQTACWDWYTAGPCGPPEHKSLSVSPISWLQEIGFIQSLSSNRRFKKLLIREGGVVETKGESQEIIVQSWGRVLVPTQFSSVTQSCPTLCDPMDFSTPGLPVHQLLEFTQTHVHWVSDAIQPSYPLSSPSPPTFNLSQHQGLFQRVSSLH